MKKLAIGIIIGIMLGLFFGGIYWGNKYTRLSNDYHDAVELLRLYKNYHDRN